jgi:hypothetical protein
MTPLESKLAELITKQKELIRQHDRQSNVLGKEWRQRVELIENDITEIEASISQLQEGEAKIEKHVMDHLEKYFPVNPENVDYKSPNQDTRNHHIRYGIMYAIEQFTAQLQSGECYPGEFVEWLTSFNNGHSERIGKGWRLHKTTNYFKEHTINNVFDYWQSNVKEK